MKTRLRTSFLITIPFVLLLNSDRVVVVTTMYGDLSGVRQVQATGDSSLSREISRWAREMTPGWNSDGMRSSSGNVRISRSTQKQSLRSDDVTAVAYDVVQRPLSLVTEYRWQETVHVAFLGNEREQAAAPVTEFEYRLNMPGKIATTNPPAQVDGRTAIFKLTADQEGYTIGATATSVRWDIIVLLVYIVGYLAYRVAALLIRRARLRPRKI